MLSNIAIVGGQWHNYKVRGRQATLMCKVHSNSNFIVMFTHASMYLCTKNIHSFCNVAVARKFLQGPHSLENIVSALESALDNPSIKSPDSKAII
jgi:hypothetical protein